MAFRKTLQANDWQGRVDLPDCYWRLNKVTVLRELQGEAPDEDDTEDNRTSVYICRCTFTIFSTVPDIQGKPIATLYFDAPLTEVEAADGDTLIAKAYAKLATTDFEDAAAV